MTAKSKLTPRGMALMQEAREIFANWPDEGEFIKPTKIVAEQHGTPGCTCPRCRLGYYPSNYTFGGNVPPHRPRAVCPHCKRPLETETERLIRRGRG